ncbi:MAG: SDR family oxidoreductase [Anaerolineae bacterium]
MDGTQFEGKVALVTGAGVGIGFAIARRLALEGASVVLNDFDHSLAEQSAQSIRDSGGRCFAFSGDVSEVAFVQEMVNYAVSTYGKLDIAVCNAGLTVWGDFFEYTEEMFERAVSLNLRGTYFLAQAAAKQMRTTGSGGKILFVSSVTGHRAIRYLSVYSMTKAALEMLARNLVVELSPFNITVNCVAPGATVTPRNLTDDPNYEAVWASLTPLGKAGQPDDVAAAATFLVSQSADHVTGQTLIVDGGWSAISPVPSLDFVEKPDK